MAKLVVLYPPPTDPAEFDRAYRDEHIPMMRDTMVGLTVAITTITSAAPVESPYYLMTQIVDPSLDHLRTLLASAGGEALTSHALKISTGGPPIVLFSEEEVHHF